MTTKQSIDVLYGLITDKKAAVSLVARCLGANYYTVRNWLQNSAVPPEDEYDVCRFLDEIVADQITEMTEKREAAKQIEQVKS